MQVNNISGLSGIYHNTADKKTTGNVENTASIPINMDSVDISKEEKYKFIIDNEGYVDGLYIDFEVLKMGYDEALEFLDFQMNYGEDLTIGNARAGMNMLSLFRKATLDNNLSKNEKTELLNTIEEKYIAAQEVLNPGCNAKEWGKTSLEGVVVMGDRYSLTKVIDAFLDGDVALATKLREHLISDSPKKDEPVNDKALNAKLWRNINSFWDGPKDETAYNSYKKDYLDVFLSE